MELRAILFIHILKHKAIGFLTPLLLNCEKTFVGDGYYLNKVFYIVVSFK